MNILFTVVLALLMAVGVFKLALKRERRGLVYIGMFMLLAADIWRVNSVSLQHAITTGSPMASLATIQMFGVMVGSLDLAVAAALIAFIAAVSEKPNSVNWAIGGEAAAIATGIILTNTVGGFIPGSYLLLVGILPAAWQCRSQIADISRAA